MSFKSDNWLIGADRRLLVSIALTDPESKRETNYPSNPTVYFCDIPDTSTGYFTYGGTVYQPTIQKFSGNSASIDFRGSASDADATLVLANIRYPFQFKHSVGAPETNQYNVKLSQLFADYLWSGATVTATCYCKVGATETTQVVFSGIVYAVSVTVNAVTVRVIQDKKAIRSKPDAEGPGSATYPSIVTQTAYPKAPPSSIGATLPMVYGTSAAATIIEAQYGLCVNPANLLGLWQPVLYETQYDGTYLGRFMAGAYPTQTAPGGSMYWFYAVNNPQTLAVMKTSDVTVTKNATETYLSVFANATAYIYINPTDFRAKSGANVVDPGKSFDGKDTTYCAITSAGATEYLHCNLPQMSTLGKMKGCYMWVLLAPGTGVGAGDGTVNGAFGIYDEHAAPGYHHAISQNLTKANLRDGGFISLDLTSTTYDDVEWSSWQWQDATAGGVVFDLFPRIEVSTSGATANLIAWGVRAQFIPDGVLTQTYITGNSNNDPNNRRDS